MTSAVFLDRDGVINVDHGYVSTWEQFEFLPGVPEALRKRLEARRAAEAQGGYQQTELGKSFQRFRANLHAKQAMQKRAASALPLRKETVGEMIEAIERSAMRPRSPGNRKKITIGNFDKRQRVGAA